MFWFRSQSRPPTNGPRSSTVAVTRVPAVAEADLGAARQAAVGDAEAGVEAAGGVARVVVPGGHALRIDGQLARGPATGAVARSPANDTRRRRCEAADRRQSAAEAPGRCAGTPRGRRPTVVAAGDRARTSRRPSTLDPWHVTERRRAAAALAAGTTGPEPTRITAPAPSSGASTIRQPDSRSVPRPKRPCGRSVLARCQRAVPRAPRGRPSRRGRCRDGHRRRGAVPGSRRPGAGRRGLVSETCDRSARTPRPGTASMIVAIAT